MATGVLFSLYIAGVAATACPEPLRTFHLFDRHGQQLHCFDHWQQAFFQELGCPLTFREGNPTTSVREQQLQDGQIELITGLAKNQQRAYQFSAAIASNNVYLYRKVSAPQWEQIKDWCDPIMRQARIMLPADGYFGEKVQQLRQQADCANWVVHARRGAGYSFEMLLKNRADLLISPEYHWRDLPTEQRQQFVRLSLPVVEGNVYLAFGKQVSPAFIQRVNRQIAARHQRQVPLCHLPPATTP